MIQEPETLYKLMTLYLLREVSFPLTNSQICQFFLDRDYTTYFTLQQVLRELSEDHLIDERRSGTQTRYEISEEGAQTLSFFVRDLSPSVISDMDAYLKENRFRLRSEAGTTANYVRMDANNYVVRCEVREGKNILIGLDLSVPDEKQAADICAAWSRKNQEIYSLIMRKLGE